MHNFYVYYHVFEYARSIKSIKKWVSYIFFILWVYRSLFWTAEAIWIAHLAHRGPGIWEIKPHQASSRFQCSFGWKIHIRLGINRYHVCILPFESEKMRYFTFLCLLGGDLCIWPAGVESHRGAGLLEQVLRSLSKAQNVISIFRTLINMHSAFKTKKNELFSWWVY